MLVAELKNKSKRNPPSIISSSFHNLLDIYLGTLWRVVTLN